MFMDNYLTLRVRVRMHWKRTLMFVQCLRINQDKLRLQHHKEVEMRIQPEPLHDTETISVQVCSQCKRSVMILEALWYFVLKEMEAMLIRLLPANFSLYPSTLQTPLIRSLLEDQNTKQNNNEIHVFLVVWPICYLLGIAWATFGIENTFLVLAAEEDPCMQLVVLDVSTALRSIRMGRIRTA